MISEITQSALEVITITNPKVNSDSVIFSNAINNKSQIYVLDRKSGNLTVEVLNGFGPSNFLKFECEKSNDESSVLREIHQLQNKPNKF